MKFSIITVTFNSERTLGETMESVLKQAHRPLQYIIVDGASTDSTMEKVLAYKPRFEAAGIEFIWKSEKDQGISDAFNKGIQMATGDIVGIINSDDKLYDGALEVLEKAYEPSVGIYHGDCVIFSSNHTNEYVYKPRALRDFKLIEVCMAINHPATFVTLDTYRKIGLFDISYKLVMDRELMMRAYRSGVKFKYVDAILAYYREGGASQANYKKTAIENMNISIKYGMHPLKAQMIRHYYSMHDKVWLLVQKLGLEKYFHKELEK